MKASITKFPWLDPKYDTKILAELTKVRPRQPGQYRACCHVGAAGFLERDDGKSIQERKAAPEKEAA
jgi:hypothetical protein